MTGLCRSGKTAYPDEQAARVALVEIRAASALHNIRRRTPCRAYECQFCAEWHLTSQPGRQRRAAS